MRSQNGCYMNNRVINMKKIFTISFLLMALVLTACGESNKKPALTEAQLAAAAINQATRDRYERDKINREELEKADLQRKIETLKNKKHRAEFAQELLESFHAEVIKFSFEKRKNNSRNLDLVLEAKLNNKTEHNIVGAHFLITIEVDGEKWVNKALGYNFRSRAMPYGLLADEKLETVFKDENTSSYPDWRFAEVPENGVFTIKPIKLFDLKGEPILYEEFTEQDANSLETYQRLAAD